MTTGCFPMPMPGELLYGMLARHRQLSGARTAADHAIELFGRRAAIATFDLPCRLDALADRLPAGVGVDGRGLLAHTLYPFYAAFQTQETRDAVECDLRSSESSNAHHRLGVAAFRIRSGGALRFCPDCMDRQISEFGVATWLVAHQLPGVPVCAEHGRWLQDSRVTRTTAGRHGYVMATSDSCPRYAKDSQGSRPIAVARLWELSRAAADISVRMACAHPLDYWREHYVERLAGVGLMRSPCKVDQVGLNEGLGAHWGTALRHLPAPCSSLGESGWAAAMVRSHRNAMHPLFHLLLDGFISHREHGGAVSAVRDAGETRTTIEDDASPKPIMRTIISSSGRSSRVDWASLDERMCDSIRAAADDIRAVSPPVRVSRSEVERRVARADWFGKRRSKLPSSLLALVEVEEPLADYRRRRAEHWIDQLGSSCRAWEVMRAAGLRSEQLPMIRESMADRSAVRSASR